MTPMVDHAMPTRVNRRPKEVKNHCWGILPLCSDDLIRKVDKWQVVTLEQRSRRAAVVFGRDLLQTKDSDAATMQQG